MSYESYDSESLTCLHTLIKSNQPNLSALQLYLLVAGGLLDATTDTLYLAYEDFDSWELKLVAFGVMVLPIMIVVFSFWAFIFIDYKKQTWRILFLPVDGVVKLAFVVYASFTSFAWLAFKNVIFKVHKVHKQAIDSMRRMYSFFSEKPEKSTWLSLRGMIHRVYYEVHTERENTVTETNNRHSQGYEGGPIEVSQEEIIELRFYAKGGVQALVVRYMLLLPLQLRLLLFDHVMWSLPCVY